MSLVCHKEMYYEQYNSHNNLFAVDYFYSHQTKNFEGKA